MWPPPAGTAERPLCRGQNAEAEARRAYLSAHGAASASGEGRALDALTEELSAAKRRWIPHAKPKRQKVPLPAPRACWLCCAAAALLPASRPKS